MICTNLFARCLLRMVAGGSVLACLLAGLAFAQPAPKAAADAKAADGKAADPKADPAAAKKEAPKAAAPEEDEWIVELGRDDREERGKLTKYRELIAKGSFASEDERKLLKDVVRWKLAQFTLKRNREAPPAKKEGEKAPARTRQYTPLDKIRADIILDVNSAGNLGKGTEVKPYLLDTILKECPALLEYHFAAQLNCAILLSELNAKNDEPVQPYIPANTLLIKIARDGTRLDAVRIWGVIGCRRLLMYEQTPAEVRNAIVKALTEQLKEHNKATREEKARHDWLNFRLVEALGWSNTIMIERKPEVVEALAQVVIDTEHPWRPRYYASQAIGRLPMDGSINLSMISVEIARLGQQIALEYNKTPDDPMWKIACFRIYFAFRPETDVDRQRQHGLKNQVDSKGALGASKKPVTEAYEAVLPIINEILKGKTIDPPALDKLNKWLLDNTPRDFKVHPQSNPLALPPGYNNKVAKGNGPESPAGR